MLHTATKESSSIKKNLSTSRKIEKMITEDDAPILSLPLLSDKISPNAKLFVSNMEMKPEKVRIKPQLVIDTPHELADEELDFKFDKYRQLFTVHRKTGVKVGGFTIPQIVNLMVAKKMNLPPEEETMTQYLVTNLIGYPNVESSFGCVFKTPDQSAFMADIESVIRLNNTLFHYESKHLPDLLKQYVDSEKQIIVKKTVKYLIFDLLHHTLKLLNLVIEKIRNDPSKKALKQSIAHYTVGIVYRITNFVHDEVNYYGNQLKKVNENYKLVIKSRETLGFKIDELVQALNNKPVAADPIVDNNASAMSYERMSGGERDREQDNDSPSNDCFYEEIGRSFDDDESVIDIENTNEYRD